VRRTVDIRDVAKRAGVSVGTVSRVVNAHPSVSSAKRELVLGAIAELKYRPDAFARGLRKRTSDTIGVIIPDIRNPFFAELIHWIEIRARALGFSVLFVTSDEDPRAEAEQVEAFAARKVDGILWVPSYRAVHAPNAGAIPIVAVDRQVAELPSVAADNRGGARRAVDYLFDLGHQVVGFDNIPAVQPLIKSGKMLATVEQYGADMAKMGIDYGLKELAGQTFTGWVKTPVKLIEANDLS